MEKDAVSVPNMGFFCSLVCLVPWSSFVVIHDPGKEDILASSKYDEIGYDEGKSEGDIQNSDVHSIKSSIENIFGDNGWSVFHARRKNSIDSSSDSMSGLPSSNVYLNQRSPLKTKVRKHISSQNASS